MKNKPIMPYQRLFDEFKAYARAIKYRRTLTMWHYPKAKLAAGWPLVDLSERVAAAKQLGYEVVLENTDEGLTVKYQKRCPDAPWSVRP